MKKYEPETMVTVSRCQNWFPTLPEDVQRDVYARMRELLEEEKRTSIKFKVSLKQFLSQELS